GFRLASRTSAAVPGLAEEADPVAVQDAGHGLLTVAAAAQQLGQPLQVGNGVEVPRRLLAAKAAVEVGADGRVPAVGGDVADAVDVIDDVLQPDADVLGPGLAAHPAGHHHPGVQGAADDGAAADEPADLLVGQLALVGHQGPAVVVAGQHRTAVVLQGL